MTPKKKVFVSFMMKNQPKRSFNFIKAICRIDIIILKPMPHRCPNLKNYSLTGVKIIFFDHDLCLHDK